MFENVWVLGFGAGLFILVFFLIFWIPKRQCRLIEDAATRIALENDVRMNTAQIFGGILVLGTLVLSIQEFLFNQKAEIKNQARAQYSQDTQFFMEAVAELGNDEPTNVIAAIGAIGRIMETSPKDFWPLTEILTAFVRQEAAIEGDVRHWTNQDPKHPEYRAEAIHYKPNSKPRHHIEAAVQLLGRPSIAEKRNCLRHLKIKQLGYKPDKKERWFGRELELRETDLSGFHLSRLDLRHANLRGSNLINSNFQNTILIGVDAQSSQWGAPLSEAILDDTTNLSWSDIQNLHTNHKKASIPPEPDSALGCTYLFEPDNGAE